MNTHPTTQNADDSGLKDHPEQSKLNICDRITDHNHHMRTHRLGGFLGTLPKPQLVKSLTPRSRILQGDCVERLRQIRSGSVDFVLTDPPYLVRYQDRNGRSIANDDNSKWIQPAFAELYRVLKPNSYCVSFYGWSKAECFLSAWKACGFQPIGHFVWVKNYASRVRHCQMKHEQAYLLAKGNPLPPKRPPMDILPWYYTGNTLHPTQKPVASLTPLIDAYSPRNGVVLDPFAGSGSTGVAALMCRRRCLLVEKDASHQETIRSRLAKLPHYLTTTPVFRKPRCMKIVLSHASRLLKR